MTRDRYNTVCDRLLFIYLSPFLGTAVTMALDYPVTLLNLVMGIAVVYVVPAMVIVCVFLGMFIGMAFLVMMYNIFLWIVGRDEEIRWH